ncbi:MAG: hypothetical protein OEU54_12480 [Gemmatimonadota bacterium]|nr:hypothetical protein [Gemmatimonadota bacterium]
MLTRRTVWLVALASLVVPQSQGALYGQASQESLILPQGSRVRVSVRVIRNAQGQTIWPARRLKGSVHQVTGDSLYFTPEDADGPSAVSIGDISRLEVVTGRRRNWDRGLMIGGGIGVLGALGWVAICSDVDCEGEEAMMALSVVFYGALGAGIGALSSRDTWDDIPFDDLRPTMGVFAGRPFVGFRLATPWQRPP